MQIPVESETVRSVGYDACSRVLRVAFGSGGTYEYVGVPLQMYEAILMPHLVKTARRSTPSQSPPSWP